MAAKKTDVSVFIAQNVGAMSRTIKDGDKAVGSLLLEGIGELFERIGAEECTIEIGGDYALAIKNAELARKGDAPLKSVDKLDKFARFGMVKVMRIATDRKWSAKFLANVATLHREDPVKITTMLDFGRRIFGGKINGKEMKPVDNCPTVDDLRAWRKVVKKKGKRGPKAETTPADRIKVARDALDGFATWLPKPAHDHVVRALSELSTVADMVGDAPKTVDEKADAIAKLKAELAKLTA